MSKYEIGQQIPVGGIITITAATQNKQGTWIYNTDRKASVPEYFIESLEMKPLEKVQPEPKQEYLNMKVVCVEATDIGVTLGKVYTVENGVFTWNSGGKSATGATTIGQFNSWFVGAKFIEFKGE